MSIVIADSLGNEVGVAGTGGPDPEEQIKPKQLPIPATHKVLIALPKPTDTFESGIAKAAVTREIEEAGSVVGYVLAMGPSAFSDIDRFPSGPSCKIGDFVLVGAYRGTRFKIHNQEFRMINDDQIEGVVQDPTGYSRA